MGQEKIRDVVYHAMHTLVLALLRHMSPDTFSNSTPRWQFADIVGRAKLYATTDLQRLALEKFVVFRNGWAHIAEVEPYSWGDLAQSFAVLEDWLEELPPGSSPYILADHITMARMAQCMCSMAKAVMLPADSEKWNECPPQLHGYCTRTINSTDACVVASSSSGTNIDVQVRPSPEEQVTLLLDAQDGKVKRTEIDREQFMWCGTVIEHKQHHRDDMKGKRVMLLSGKYPGKTAIFRGWDSTKCNVNMEFNEATISVPGRTLMGVFKDQPKTDTTVLSSPANPDDREPSDPELSGSDVPIAKVEARDLSAVTEVFEDLTPPQRTVSRCAVSGDFLLTGTIDDIKHSTNASWVKGRKVVFLSGVWINRTGTINSWSGTTTFVTIDGEDNSTTKRRVANRCKIGVLH